ncbi:hypothetical protein KI387_011009, partial [Taxus chinensis]
MDEVFMSSHINNLRSLIRQLAEVKAAIEDEDAKAILLNNLSSKYNNVVFTLSQIQSQSLDDMIATLLVEEKRTTVEDAEGDPQQESAFYSKTKNFRRRSDKDKREIECHYCKKRGHTTWDCCVRANDVLKGKGISNAANIAMVEDPPDAEALLSTVYLGCLYGLYVPDWKFEIPTINLYGNSSNVSVVHTVKCGVRGSLEPACNVVRMIDYSILGVKHLYQNPMYKRTKECSVNSPDYGPLPKNAPLWCQAAFDPEGLLSSVMASLTCFIGLHFGHILVNFKGHRDRIHHWIISSFVLILFGIFLEILGMPLNKPLYTFSYLCVTSGTAGSLFAAIYLFVDVYGYKRPTILLEWMGLNSLIIYALAACDVFAAAIQGFYWRLPKNNI